MKTIKFSVILFILFTTVICAFADSVNVEGVTQIKDSVVDTVKVSQSTKIIENLTKEHEDGTSNLNLIISLIIMAYELIVRYMPTTKNISILSFIIKLLQKLVPNFKSGGGKHSA